MLRKSPVTLEVKKIEICVIKSYVEEKSLVVGTKESVIKPENNTTLEAYA